jgi:KDO2-lipid IV(A) lauroyltransferase
MMAVIVHSGLNCRVSYRPANNPYMDQRIVESRRRYGVRLEAARGGEGTRGLIAQLSGGGAVAMLNDQRDSSGTEAPFFGRPVFTAAGPARLALKFCGELMPMSVVRTRGARFRVTIHEPIVLERTADRARDLQQAVASINAFVEARIRERPAEWLWAHRRWPVQLYEDRAAVTGTSSAAANLSESSLRRQGPS